MEYSQIEATQKEIFRGRYEVTYRWIGNPHVPARVSDCLMLGFSDLPWPTKVIRVEGNADQWLIVARTDGFNLVTFWYWLLRTRLGELARRFYYRFVLTLNIWGLAYTHEACVPSWRDIGKRRA